MWATSGTQFTESESRQVQPGDGSYRLAPMKFHAVETMLAKSRCGVQLRSLWALRASATGIGGSPGGAGRSCGGRAGRRRLRRRESWNEHRFHKLDYHLWIGRGIAVFTARSKLPVELA
jgi:hypothetical protein